MSQTATATVTNLDNCDAEPIHIPGAIQPHGVLLATRPDDLRIEQLSTNTEELLGRTPVSLFGQTVDSVLDQRSAAIVRANATAKSWRRVNPLIAQINGRTFDAIMHRSDERLVVELEPCELVLQENYRDYSAHIHSALLRLQSADDLSELLSVAAAEVRQITGYDRVMVYRFDRDGHGEVVAEERIPSIESFLGLHYPASDIPQQARRLYTVNWLRIIADVGYTPSPIIGATRSNAPLDLSHSVLRSVSPIHIEYLVNMGVAASMSVSIIVENKLWGLIACHHYSPKFVPFAVRLTCELLAQTLSNWVATRESAQLATARAERSLLRSELLDRVRTSDSVGRVLTDPPDAILKIARADGVVVLYDGRLSTVGIVPPEPQVRKLAAWLSKRDEQLFETDGIALDYPDAPELGAEISGVLAAGFPAGAQNFIMWFRREQVRTVSWGGDPKKVFLTRPHGTRLTPRGSFALWQENVRGRALRWTAATLATTGALRTDLLEVTAQRINEFNRTRDMLLAVVSHDLRNPLNAISLSAKVLAGGERDTVNKVSARISASSDRMKRMIEQLLDYTRIKNNAFSLAFEETDIALLCRQLGEEIELAHPDSQLCLDLQQPCVAYCDPDRIAQSVSNLLGNARHHGASGRPITLRVRCEGGGADVEVHNFGQVISEEEQRRIFEPFIRGQHVSTRSGLGLGLYIVQQLIDAHQGTVSVRSSAEEGTTFRIRLPRRSPTVSI